MNPHSSQNKFGISFRFYASAPKANLLRRCFIMKTVHSNK